MNLDYLDEKLQNDIVMMARPTYPYLKEIKYLSDWYDGEGAFHNENKYRWMFDAIKLRKDIETDRLAKKLFYIAAMGFAGLPLNDPLMDIKGNFLNF